MQLLDEEREREREREREIKRVWITQVCSSLNSIRQNLPGSTLAVRFPENKRSSTNQIQALNSPVV